MNHTSGQAPRRDRGGEPGPDRADGTGPATEAADAGAPEPREDREEPWEATDALGAARRALQRALDRRAG